MAYLRKKTSGFYLVDKSRAARDRNGGKDLWVPLGPCGARQAKLALDRYNTGHRATQIAEAIEETTARLVPFKLAADEYLANAKRRKLKAASTLSREEYVIKMLQAEFRDKYLHHIKPESVEMISVEKGHSREGALNLKKVMVSVYEFAKERGDIPDNYMRKITVPKKPKQKKAKSIPDDIIHKLLNAMTGRRRAYFEILYYTGMRPGEAIKLKVEDVMINSGFIRVMETKKHGTVRKVAINSKILEQLEWLVENASEETGYLFPNADDTGHQESFKPALMRAKKRAEITAHVTQYGFRHSFGHRLLKATGNLRLVQKAMNHARITTTEIYTDVLDGDVDEAISNL